LTKQVNFEIAVEGVTLNLVVSKLDKLGLKVLPYSKQELGKHAYDPNNIVFIGYFPDDVAIELVVGQMNSLARIDGVKCVKILSVSQLKGKTKKQWYNHFVIPLLISTTVNSLGVFGILLGGNINLDWKIYLGLFSAVTSFWSAVVYRHYKSAV
jgi:hypothetical protein